MDLEHLHTTWTALRQTRSRKRKTGLLAALLRASGEAEIGIVVSYLSGHLPQGKIGIGYAALREARDRTLGRQGHGNGNLGKRGRGRGDAMPLLDLDRTFRAIAEEKGSGSGARRRRLLADLFASISLPERNFVSGLILGELRQGASEGLMCEAIAEAAEVPATQVRRALMLCGNLPRVAIAAIRGGSAALEDIRVELFVPLRPMLARPEVDVHTAIANLGEALFEAKLDGARVQAHKDGSEIRVYTRALNEVTHSVPEVVEAVKELPASSLILDGETIALRSDGGPQPFQATMRRFGRTHDVDAQREALPLSVYFFDLLYLDGESLIDRPLRDRRQRLESLLPTGLLPSGSATSDVEQAEALWSNVIAQGHEGLMAKAMESTYEAGSRGGHWLKLKPAHTLDLVVIGAEWGSGRRKRRFWRSSRS